MRLFAGAAIYCLVKIMSVNAQDEEGDAGGADTGAGGDAGDGGYPGGDGGGGDSSGDGGAFSDASGEVMTGHRMRASDTAVPLDDENSTAAAEVEKSVPPYPPLGEKSAAMDRWTPEGILNSVKSNDEGSFGDRWNVQKALSASVDEKNASMTGVMKLVEDSRKKMMKFAKISENVTQLLYADASAGGLVASARNIRNEVPATQKLLSKTMTDQLRSLQQDALVLKNTVQVAESEYRERIKAMGDSVSSMIVQQDALFARLAAQQARAMARTSQTMQAGALKDLSPLRSQITDTSKAAAAASAKAFSGINTAGRTLHDVEDSLAEVDSQYKSAVNGLAGSVQSEIIEQTDRSTQALDKAIDSATLANQASAMMVGQQLARELDSLDREATSSLEKMVDNTTKATDKITKEADKIASSTESAVNQATNDLIKKIDEVDTQSELVASDQLTVSTDMRSIIDKQHTISGAAGAGFATDMAKVMALIAAKLGGLTGQAKEISQDVVGGTSEESVRLSRALTYLLIQAALGSNGIGATASSQLAAKEKVQAELLAQLEAEIGGAGQSLDSQLSDAIRAALRGAGALSERVAGMGAIYGGSIEALMASLHDVLGSASQGINQISGALGGLASDAFSRIIDALKGVNGNGADQEEDFLKTILGPARDGSAKQMDQLHQLLAALSVQLDGQSGGQRDTMLLLRGFQMGSGRKLNGAGKALDGLINLSSQLVGSVGAAGEKGLADIRAHLMEAMIAELNGAKNQSDDGIDRINALINFLIGGEVSETIGKVGNVMALASANLDASSQNFVNVEREQIKSLAGLSSMAASLLADSANAGMQQRAETEASLVDARKNIVAKFKEIAATTTDTEMGRIIQDLAKQGNETKIVEFLLGDVQSALSRIDMDAVIAREAAEKKKADFEAYLASTRARLQKAQTEIMDQLDRTVGDVQKALDDRVKLIQTSQREMTMSLDDIKQKVETAQKTLAEKLQIYQEKLDAIMQEIRSYMNLSAEADELAIRRDIAGQLGKVNATEVAIASANAAVEKGIQDRSKSTAQNEGATFDIVDNVINGAVATEASVSGAHLGTSQELLAVASTVDAQAMELDGSIKTASTLMENGIADASSVSGRAIVGSEAGQAKAVGQLNDRASDVASQSRKNFINNLDRMGMVDDDTLRVSKQLQTLIGNADGTITDVSESAMSHLDLSIKTMAKLNQAEVRKVASVSDVMQAFSAVVMGFLNETGSTMNTVMNELNAVDSASKAKLKEIDIRSKDELNWIGSGLNTTSDSFKQALAQEQAMQSGLKKQLLLDEAAFKASEASKESEPSDIQDQVTALKQKVNKHQSDELAKVRGWITSRNPQVSKALFSKSGAFVQTKSRDAVIREIRGRMEHIKHELSLLESAH